MCNLTRSVAPVSSGCKVKKIMGGKNCCALFTLGMGGELWDVLAGVRAPGVASVRCAYAGLNVRSA